MTKTTKTPSKKTNGGRRIAKSESTKTEKKDTLTAFYAKYSHVVKGSVRESKSAAHGFVCDVECKKRGCQTVTTVNKQDAFQVLFCEEHRREAQLARKQLKREARQAKKTTRRSKKEATAQAHEVPAPANSDPASANP